MSIEQDTTIHGVRVEIDRWGGVHIDLDDVDGDRLSLSPEFMKKLEHEREEVLE